MSRLWRIIAGGINVRTLTLLLAVLMLSNTWQPNQYAEKKLLSLGSELVEPPSPTLNIAIVELSDTEMDQLLRGDFSPHFYTDINTGSTQPRTLNHFASLFSSSKAPVGLIVQEPIDWKVNPTLHILKKLGIPSFPELQRSSLIEFQKNYQQLEHQLLNGKTTVIGLGLPNCQPVFSSVINYSPEIPTTQSSFTHYIEPLPPTLKPLPPRILTPALSVSNRTPTINGTSQPVSAQHNPAPNCNQLDYPLLWNRVSPDAEDLIASFAITVYQKFVQADTVKWEQYGHLFLDGIRMPLSPDGSFIPYNFPTDSGNTLTRIPLHRYSSVLDADIILVGAKHDPLLERTANSLQAMEVQSYLYTPALSFWLAKLIIILLAIYLTFLLPKMSTIVALLLTSLIAITLLIAQLGWQITQSAWLPLFDPLCFLLLGHLLMIIWITQDRHQQTLIQKTDSAQYELGLQLYRDGRAEDALKTITDTSSSPHLLELMYDIGAQFERKRLYAEALQTYQSLQSRKRRYRDTGEKIARLQDLQQTDSSGISNNPALTKTLVLTDAKVQKPVLGRYEIERELGRGAMGVVYLGRDPKIARQVAIKTLNYSQFDSQQLSELKERFFREAEAAGRLSHPSIVTVYDVGEERDLAFIAMDYLEGKPLSDFIHSTALLPVLQVYRIIAEVAQALDYAHSKRIVHRDIKPANIMFNESNGQVTVTDFGIARITDDSRTRTGDVMGSPLYMSPEQLKGDKVGSSADIFSLGITMYQLLTGKLPFSGDNLANLTYNIIHSSHKGPREWRNELPASATRIINKALQKSPEKRFLSASDMCDAIRKSMQKDFDLESSN